MRKFFVIGLMSLITLVFAGAALAASNPRLPEDRLGRPVNVFGANATKQRDLTVNSTTIDMRDDLRWAVNCPNATSKFRSMSTATKAGTQRPLPNGTWFERGVNKNKGGFINFSGCASGFLDRD